MANNVPQAPQRQLLPRDLPSPSVFLLISAHFTATPGIPVSPTALKTMGAEVVLVGPPTFHVDDPSWFGCYQTSHFDEVIGDVDVVYMLRVQLERVHDVNITNDLIKV